MTLGRDYIDLEFQGSPSVIATAILAGEDGVALVDPGPTSCLATLERGLHATGKSLPDVRALLLTHIHLDHAGASGTIVRRHPSIEVFVHERGVRHMIDPAKLIDSAARLYGADMDRLWGEVLPLPEPQVRLLRGGERLAVVGRELDVMYTPGHASHHVTYVDRHSGVAYVGDVAGIRRGRTAFVLPPTPPPDVDLEAWQDSLDRLMTRAPATLFTTHFGPWTDTAGHVAAMREALDDFSARVRESLAAPGTDEERARAFADDVRRVLRDRLSPDEAFLYERAGRFDFSWHGLARYWRKRTEAAPA